MRAEDFDQATIEQLQAHANKCFDLAQSPLEEPQLLTATGKNLYLDNDGKLRLLLEAQFYVTAVARKRDEQVARRDFLLEIAVIALIGIEIILSIVGIGIGIREANQQTKALSNIEESTRDAASAMSTVSTSIKALADEQAASRSELRTMSEILQSSLATTGTMASSPNFARRSRTR